MRNRRNQHQNDFQAVASWGMALMFASVAIAWLAAATVKHRNAGRHDLAFFTTAAAAGIFSLTIIIPILRLAHYRRHQDAAAQQYENSEEPTSPQP